MKKRLVLSLLVLLSLGCAAFQRAVFYGQNVTVASGPTYQRIAAESGSCSALGTSCTITVNTTNGDLWAINCVNLGGNGGTRDCQVVDVNGENIITETSLNPNNGATGISNGSAAVIANAGTGDLVTCTAKGAGSTAVVCTVDAFRSSSGWTDQGDGTPTDNVNYVLASPSGPCTVTAPDPNVQANELVYGSCFATAGTVSSASGYTTAQNNTFASIGQVYTAYKPITTIQTSTFTTNGTLTDPQSLILTFAPN